MGVFIGVLLAATALTPARPSGAKVDQHVPEQAECSKLSFTRTLGWVSSTCGAPLVQLTVLDTRRVCTPARPMKKVGTAARMFTDEAPPMV